MPDRKIFLASSSIRPETYPEFQKLSGNLPHETKVGFLTSRDNNFDRIDEVVKSLRTKGFSVRHFDISTCHPHFLKRALQEVNMVYVNGGNTFNLLYWMRKSKLHELLPELLDNGVIYYGSSAGSLVAGPNIEMAGWHRSWDRNKIGLTDFSGLGIINIAVFPHFDPKHREVIAPKATSLNYLIVAITDSQAVIANGPEYKIVGIGKASFFGQSYSRTEDQQPLAAASLSR